MSKVLILGCGYLGQTFSKLLIQNSHDVVTTRRNISKLPKEFNPISIDFLKPEEFKNLPLDVEYIFYMASAGDHSKEAYKNAYNIGLNNALTYAENIKSLKRFIFISSTGVYPDQNGGSVDENSKRLSLDSNSPSVEIVKGEDSFLERKTNFEKSIVRFSGLYGEERVSLISRIKSGQAKLNQNTKDSYTNRIHIKDCARVLLFLMSVERLEPVYIGSDDCPATQEEIYSFLADILNVKIEIANEELLGSRYGSKKCDNSLLKNSGFKFKYPTYKEGYKSILGVS